MVYCYCMCTEDSAMWWGRAQAKLMKLVDDVVVDSYNKVAVDLDSMRAMLPAHTGDLGNHETTHAGMYLLQ